MLQQSSAAVRGQVKGKSIWMTNTTDFDLK